MHMQGSAKSCERTVVTKNTREQLRQGRTYPSPHPAARPHSVPKKKRGVTARGEENFLSARNPHSVAPQHMRGREIQQYEINLRAWDWRAWRVPMRRRSMRRRSMVRALAAA